LKEEIVDSNVSKEGQSTKPRIPVLSTLNSLHPATKNLLLMRGLRSLGQGALVVDFTLYLSALGWSSLAIGSLLTAAGLFGAALSLFVGVSSDRSRRKPFLLVYQGMTMACSLAGILTAQPAILSVAAILGGFGRGANGAAGPFSPAEQAWLAEEIAPKRRGVVYSLNTAVGFLGMGIGSALAVLPDVWGRWLGGPLAYRPIFGIVTLTSIFILGLLVRTEEKHVPLPKNHTLQVDQRQIEIHQRQNNILAKLAMINGVNGVAIGLTGPLISYWFYLKFHVGPAAIAPVMAVTFLITGLASLVTGRMTQRIGVVNSVIWTRVVGLVLLVMLPLMPIYWLAAGVYLLRSAFNRGSAGARQAITIGLVDDDRRGLAVSLNNVSAQLPQAIGPTIAAYMLGIGDFSLPFYIAAVLQAVYLVLYGRTFRAYEP
jgi:MFS family permease